MKAKQQIFLLLLAVAVFGIIGTTAVSAAGESNQKVEYASGNTGSVYPILTMPNPNECGPDSDDIILQYNTYWGPSVNPDNVRWNSDVWLVKYWIRAWYPSGLSANGLGTTTTRVCMGTLGQTLGPDNLELLYLWHT